MAMIKGNGYGHGLELAAKALQNADSFGVARLDEALRFRSVFPNQTVTIMNTFASDEELKRISYYRIDIIIHTIELADLLECVRLENPIRVWLKLDTGLNRLGINLTTAEIGLQKTRTEPECDQTSGTVDTLRSSKWVGSQWNGITNTTFQYICQRKGRPPIAGQLSGYSKVAQIQTELGQTGNYALWLIELC